MYFVRFDLVQATIIWSMSVLVNGCPGMIFGNPASFLIRYSVVSLHCN